MFFFCFLLFCCSSPLTALVSRGGAAKYWFISSLFRVCVRSFSSICVFLAPQNCQMYLQILLFPPSSLFFSSCWIMENFRATIKISTIPSFSNLPLLLLQSIIACAAPRGFQARIATHSLLRFVVAYYFIQFLQVFWWISSGEKKFCFRWRRKIAFEECYILVWEQPSTL